MRAQKARSAKLININLPWVYSILFRCSLKEILEQKIIILLKNRLLQQFLQSKKLSRAAGKALRDRMRPAGRILFRPALNAHKPKHGKT